MIDYLNAHVVMGMARFLPEQDKLELWSLKPEIINGFNAVETLADFSPESQKKILDTIEDPNKRKRLKDEIGNKMIGGVHVSLGPMGIGGCVDPKSIDITGNFGIVRRRRICSHADNRLFFAAHENFRSAY